MISKLNEVRLETLWYNRDSLLAGKENKDLEATRCEKKLTVFNEEVKTPPEIKEDVRRQSLPLYCLVIRQM